MARTFLLITHEVKPRMDSLSCVFASSIR